MGKPTDVETLLFCTERVQGSLFRLLDNFQLLGDRDFLCAIPSDTSTELAKGILATIKAHSLGLKSIDYTLKRYGEDWDLAADGLTDNDKTFNNLLKCVTDEITRVVNWVASFTEKPDRVGLVAAGCALRRLETSFRASGLLIRLGYIFEASATCRLILEQLAWAYVVHRVQSEAIFKFSPTKAIADLKTLLPEVGQVYGFLSKFTHIDPELTHLYIAFQDGDVSVCLNLPDERLEWLWALLFLTDYYSVVTEYIYRDVIPGLTVIEADHEGHYSVKPDRPLRKIIRRYRDELASSGNGR